MRGSSLILGRFTPDPQRSLAAVREFALVRLKLLPNVTLGGGERHIAVFANAELGCLANDPKFSLCHAPSLRCRTDRSSPVEIKRHHYQIPAGLGKPRKSKYDLNSYEDQVHDGNTRQTHSAKGFRARFRSEE